MEDSVACDVKWRILKRLLWLMRSEDGSVGV